MLRHILRHRRTAVERRHATEVHELLDGRAMTMLDVGAAGGILPRWAAYRSDINFIGLEPDSRSTAELLASADARHFREYRIIPCGAWSRDELVPIAFTRKPTCSSHYQPNTALLSRFADAERYDVVGSAAVPCQTLDHLLGDDASSVDFIKLDLEGGELEVLKGAPAVLAGTLGLHIEVAFHPLRQQQPLFQDVSAELSAYGLEFTDFLFLYRWERRGYTGAGQAMFADALYLRQPEDVTDRLQEGVLSTPKGFRYLAILLIYERYDLARRFLSLSPAFASKETLAILARRERAFARRLAMARTLGALLARLDAPHTSYHLLY